MQQKNVVEQSEKIHDMTYTESLGIDPPYFDLVAEHVVLTYLHPFSLLQRLSVNRYPNDLQYEAYPPQHCHSSSFPCS